MISFREYLIQLSRVRGFRNGWDKNAREQLQVRFPVLFGKSEKHFGHGEQKHIINVWIILLRWASTDWQAFLLWCLDVPLGLPFAGSACGVCQASYGVQTLPCTLVERTFLPPPTFRTVLDRPKKNPDHPSSPLTQPQLSDRVPVQLLEPILLVDHQGHHGGNWGARTKDRFGGPLQ